MCFRMGIQDKSLSSRGHYHFIMSFSLFCRRLHLACLTSSSVQGSSIDTLNSTNSARKANLYDHSTSTNVVQRPQFLGMDIEWILSFWHCLRRINILFRLRWCRIQWTTLGALGLGNDPLHCNPPHCPRKSRPYNKVAPSNHFTYNSLWTKWTIVAIPGSFVLWMGFLPIYAFVAPLLGFSTEYQGILPHLFANMSFYACIVVIPVMCLIRDFAWK